MSSKAKNNQRAKVEVNPLVVHAAVFYSVNCPNNFRPLCVCAFLLYNFTFSLIYEVLSFWLQFAAVNWIWACHKICTSTKHVFFVKEEEEVGVVGSSSF